MPSYAIGAIILGAILAVGAIIFAKAKGTRKTMGWIGAILLIPGFIALASPGTIPFLDKEINFGGGTLTTVTETATTVDGKTLCTYDGITVTLSAVNKYTSTASGGTHRYRINGAPALTVSDAGSLSATPGDTLEVLFQNGTGNYFSVLKTEVLPCKATSTINTELVQNGSLTIDVFNRNNQLIDGNSNNQTMVAGDVFTLSGRLTGTYQRGYPYGGIIVAEYNNSEIDDLIVDFGGVKTSTPSFYTVSSTDNTAKAYTVSSLISNAQLDGTIVIDADDTNNPSTSNDPVLTFYPNSYYIDEKDGGKVKGPSVEDEDNAQVNPAHKTTFTIHLT